MFRNPTTIAAAGLSALAIAGVSALPAAAAPSTAPVRSDVQSLVSDVTASAGAITGDTVSSIVGPTLVDVDGAVQSLRRQVSSITRRTRVSVQRTLNDTVAAVRRTGANAFVVVDRTGRVASGPSAVSISQPVTGLWDIAWGIDLGGCTQVAMANDRTSALLRVEPMSPVAVRVLRRSSALDLSNAGFVLAAYC